MDKRSTTDYSTMVGGNLVILEEQKQSALTTFSSEAGHQAMSHGTYE